MRIARNSRAQQLRIIRKSRKNQMRHFTAIALLATSTALSSPAFAADDAQAKRDYLPSDIVVTGERNDGYHDDDGSTATKTPTPIIDVPQTMDFITEDQLEDQAVTQLNEALRYVPGVSLETGEGHRDQVFIRGQSTTANFYLDGLRDDAEYYRSLYNVERIEVLKGANALIFGRGGGGGVINRVSKRADLAGSALNFDAAIDSFSAFNLTADVNQPLSDTVAARLATTYEEFDSHRDFYEGRFFGIAPSLTFALGERTTLIAQYNYDDDERLTDRGVPSLNGGPLTGYDKTLFGSRDYNRATSKVHIARMRLEHDFSDTLSFNATGQFADYDKFYANVVPSGLTGDGQVRLGGYSSYTDRQNLIGQANLVWDVDMDGIGNTLLIGIEGGDQSTDASRYGITFAGNNIVDLQRVLDVPAVSDGAQTRASTSDLSTFSAYIQDQIDFGPVQIIGGLRYDRFDLTATNLIDPANPDTQSRVDEKVSPRFGLVLKPQDSLSIYASYSTTFLPQSGDQFTTLGAGDAVLEPEKFANYEIGVKYAIMPKLFATAALFRLDRTNTTAPSPLGDGTIVQTGASRVEGLEMSLVGELTDFWSANLGYTYLDGEIRSETESADVGQRLHQLPKNQFSLWNRFDLNEKLGFGLGAIYQDEQYASISNNVVLPDYLRIDAAAYYTINDRASVQLNIENLFDTNYYPSAHGDNNIQPGKPFSAKIGVRFAL